MCHNVIDGRFHTECGHFYGMATQKQDCLQTNCIFSVRHPSDCRKATCLRMMSAPAHNPIRMSKTECAECKQRQRVGAIGVFPLPNNIKQAS